MPGKLPWQSLLGKGEIKENSHICVLQYVDVLTIPTLDATEV